MKPRIGFIGLGLMGAPMCKRLIKAGYKVTVWNRTPRRAQPFAKLKAAVAKTPSELAAQSDVVITMVTGPRDVGEVLFGRHGVVDGAHDGLTVIDMSTIGRQAAVGIADALKDYGIDFLDAPVTGSTPAAETGTLMIMVGGETRVLKRCDKILRAMGTPYHIGDTGSGQLIKVALNMMAAAEVAALGETLVLCQAYQIPNQTIMQVVEKSFATSPLMKMKMPVMLAQNYKTLFSLSNMAKDLKLAHLEARHKGLALRVGRAAETVHGLAMDAGHAQKDYSVVREIPCRKRH